MAYRLMRRIGLGNIGQLGWLHSLPVRCRRGKKTPHVPKPELATIKS